MSPPHTEDPKLFDPDAFFDAWASNRSQLLDTLHADNDFRKLIIDVFALPSNDDYGYSAPPAEVSLAMVQHHIAVGARGNLLNWYTHNAERPTPSPGDIAAYTDIFRPGTSTPKALKALAANAKKDTVRMDVAQHLLALYAPPHAALNLVVNKSKAHVNPYLDVWAWSNLCLEWAGPEARTAELKTSHAILPVLYHHFGCVCPSYEALAYIQQVSRGRNILDVGSGNGYWTYSLRRFEINPKKRLKVTAIDNGLSEWRTMWIGDTIECDGVKWLQQNKGGTDDVLLLVYPMVGLGFTSKMLKAFKGTTIISAGAQNASGFTAFKGETIADWIARELPGWEKILQIPLPSFAGKDEGLFIFERKTS